MRRMPAPTQLLAPPSGDAVQLAPVAIEELLNRPQVPLDRDGMARLVRGPRVLVTGAGGTIGSELARQVAALGPATARAARQWRIRALADRHRTGRDCIRSVARQICLADIRDEARIRAVFEPSGRSWCSTPRR